MAAKTKPADAPAVTPDFLNELKRLQAEFDRAKADWERAKDKAKMLKEIAEEKAEDLFSFIRGTDGAAPLFDQEDSDGDE